MNATKVTRNPLIRIAKALARDEGGATMIEYGLMLALVALVVVAGATALGTHLRSPFTTVTTPFSGS